MKKKKKSDTKVTQPVKRAYKTAKQTKKELISIYAVGSMRAARWTIVKIAKELNVSIASVNRWYKDYKKMNIDSKTPVELDETAARIKRLTKMSWKAVEEGLESHKPYGRDSKGMTELYPDNTVRTATAIRFLNAQGELIEKKEIEHSGKIKTEHDISGKLDERIDSLIVAIGGIANAKK